MSLAIVPISLGIYNQSLQRLLTTSSNLPKVTKCLWPKWLTRLAFLWYAFKRSFLFVGGFAIGEGLQTGKENWTEENSEEVAT